MTAEDHVAKVWSHVIRKDWNLWTDLLLDPKTTSGVSSSALYKNTELARLVGLCRQVNDEDWRSTVASSRSMQQTAVNDLEQHADSVLRVWRGLETVS